MKINWYKAFSLNALCRNIFRKIQSLSSSLLMLIRLSVERFIIDRELASRKKESKSKNLGKFYNANTFGFDYSTLI